MTTIPSGRLGKYHSILEAYLRVISIFSTSSNGFQSNTLFVYSVFTSNCVLLVLQFAYHCCYGPNTVGTSEIITFKFVFIRKLHRSCNILVAFCAFSDIIHSVCTFYSRTSSSNFSLANYQRSYPSCSETLKFRVAHVVSCRLHNLVIIENIFFKIFPNFGLSSGVIIILLIAIDRFIAVYFLKFYLVKDSRRYLMVRFVFIYVFPK